MPKRGELAREHRRIQREIERERKATARALVRQVRDQLRTARAEKRARIKAASESCRDARAKLKAKHEHERARLRASIAAERVAARGSCQSLRDATREQTTTIVRQLLEVHGAARHRLDQLIKHAPARTRRDVSGLVSSVERRAESDDRVRVELPADLVPVFDAVRGRIHATDYASRAEVFLQWAAEHPAEVYEIQHAAHDRAIRRLERAARSRSTWEDEAELRAAIESTRAATGEGRAYDEWGG